MFDDCIVMAGGSGTRLWPASNSKKPKQFLSAPAGGTFLSAALERALAVTDPKDGKVIIVSGRKHAARITEVCSGFTAAERKRMVLIPEPAAKSTAPAIACGLVYSNWESGGVERNILVLTSDHIIEPLSVFKANAAAAAAFARQDKLVIFGIPPARPETGYGYIEAGEALSIQPEKTIKTKKHYEPAVFKARSFREKPPLETAEQFVKKGNFFWNSGMFAFSSAFMLKEFRKNANGIIAPFLKLQDPNESQYITKKSLRILAAWQGLDEAYASEKAVSFDYAIAEKCGEAVMIRADFSWIDAGTWDEYARMGSAGKAPDDANAGAQVFLEDSESVFVDSDIPVALVGVKDLVVVIRSGKKGSPEAALIAKKGETGKVKDIVAQIKAAGRTDLL